MLYKVSLKQQLKSTLNNEQMQQMDLQELPYQQQLVSSNQQNSLVWCSQSVIAQHVKTCQSQSIQHVQSIEYMFKVKVLIFVLNQVCLPTVLIIQH